MGNTKDSRFELDLTVCRARRPELERPLEMLRRPSVRATGARLCRRGTQERHVVALLAWRGLDLRRDPCTARPAIHPASL